MSDVVDLVFPSGVLVTLDKIIERQKLTVTEIRVQIDILNKDDINKPTIRSLNKSYN